MPRFIEVTAEIARQEIKVTLNTDAIQFIEPRAEGCAIHLLGGSEALLDVTDDYKSVLRKLGDALA